MRITNNSTTLTDHIYCSQKSLVSISGVANLHLSDHCLIFCELAGTQSANLKKFVSYRHIGRINKEQFTQDFQALPWTLLDAANDVNDAVKTFQKLFWDLWDQHAPVKTRPVRPIPRKHWIYRDLLQKYYQRDKHYRQFRRTGSISACGLHIARHATTAPQRHALLKWHSSPLHKICHGYSETKSRHVLV